MVGPVVNVLMMILLPFAQAHGYARPELLVTTEWLEAHLGDQDLRVVDTRTKGYAESHVPGAVWLDIDASRDKSRPPNYLPDIDTFVSTLEKLGISSSTRVVFYDDRGGVYGTRPWLLLRLLGQENAAILNGGWPRWTSEGRTTTSEVPAVPRGKIDVRVERPWIATADDVAAAIDRKGTRIVDARSADEVAGRDLRGNPRGGAVPSSTHIDWVETLLPDGQTFKPAAELTALFTSRGLTPDEEVITYCQSGGRAAHELFVLHLMGYDDLRLYLGSWEDWSRREELPVALPPK
jgi:thiosulfate/3-mercaptopyruvate sulfurtransferase